ncbi:hypothetical protein F4775DRAFT_548107, partial [Biscogniauxia sp. FL1348]
MPLCVHTGLYICMIMGVSLLMLQKSESRPRRPLIFLHVTIPSRKTSSSYSSTAIALVLALLMYNDLFSFIIYCFSLASS